MSVIFISAPYRGNIFTRVMNIWLARRAAEQLWQSGYAVICPHTNSGLMGEQDDRFLNGYCEIMTRCDGVVFLGNWPASAGCRVEMQEATRKGMKIYFGLGGLLNG